MTDEPISFHKAAIQAKEHSIKALKELYQEAIDRVGELEEENELMRQFMETDISIVGPEGRQVSTLRRYEEWRPEKEER